MNIYQKLENTLIKEHNRVYGEQDRKITLNQYKNWYKYNLKKHGVKYKDYLETEIFSLKLK